MSKKLLSYWAKRVSMFCFDKEEQPSGDAWATALEEYASKIRSGDATSKLESS